MSSFFAALRIHRVAGLTLAGAAVTIAGVGCAAVIDAEFDRPLRAEAGTPDAGDAGDVNGGVKNSPFTVVQGFPQGESLLAVWGADEDHVYAVGTNGLHMDYYAGSWHRSQTTPGRDLYAVWGTSADDVYAVGVQNDDGKGVVVHFDGNAWRDDFLAPDALYGVWGAEGLVMAVGARGMIYAMKPGKTGIPWSSPLSKGLPANTKVDVKPDSPILWSISGTSLDDFSIAADQDRVFHYAGNGDYINLDPALDRSIVFRTVWAMPGSLLSVFFGTNRLGVTWLADAQLLPDTSADPSAREGEMLRLHEDRSSDGTSDQYIRGIWGESNRVLFVGDLGTIFHYDAGTNDFTTIPSPTPDDSLYGVWGSSMDDVWIVGARELILHGSLASP